MEKDVWFPLFWFTNVDAETSQRLEETVVMRPIDIILVVSNEDVVVKFFVLFL